MDKLLYSSVNEDAQSEIRALELGAEDLLLCITGSGARPLDLLAEGPKRVIAVDMNPLQNYLLELKLSAIKNLDYENYLGFLGVTSMNDRVSLFRSLESDLSTAARTYWNTELSMLERGVVYQGQWERHFAMMAKTVGLWRPKLLEELFSATSVAEQWKLWQQKWSTAAWRAFVKASTSRFVWRFVLRDPGFYRYVPASFSIGNYIYHCFEYSAQHVLLKNSPFARLLFQGTLSPGVLPPHLQRENFEGLKVRVGDVEPDSAPLLEALSRIRSNGELVDKFSLSDFGSYTSTGDYESTWQALAAIASSGARICERQFLVKRSLPSSVQARFCTLSGLSKRLKGEDASLFYSFQVVQRSGDQ